MLTKNFLQSRIDYFFHDYIKDEEFGKTVGMILPSTNGSTTTRTWNIIVNVTALSAEDSKRLSVDGNSFRTLDIYLQDLEALKTANPTAYIITKNFKGIANFTIDGAKYKVREESTDQQFETAIRLICERIT